MARKHRNKTLACPNCGTDLRKEFEFCPQCGQENHDLRVPFKTFLYEFVENITHFDTKLWNTLKVLFTKPGQLTKDFVEGKRARYVHPARFYVFVSFIFFLLLSVDMEQGMDQFEHGWIDGASRDLSAGDTNALRIADLVDQFPDSLRRNLWRSYDHLAKPKVTIPIDPPHYRFVADGLREATPELIDSLLLLFDKDTLPGFREKLASGLSSLPDVDSLNVPYRVPFRGADRYFTTRWVERKLRSGRLTEAEIDSIVALRGDTVGWFAERMGRFFVRMDADPQVGQQFMARSMMKGMPYVMFILMPFSAVLLLWIFFRKRFYWEHLIFSVHMHATYFLIFSMLLCIGLVFRKEWPDAVSGTIVLACLVYLLMALKHVYGRRWGSTLLRFCLMGVPYFLLCAGLTLASVILGLLTFE
ncbi:MAG: DUF3667 domain-containing protein [Flavobacteriales bacterium]|nr:DUF3667 domain-containing protein [Flavobacteriales bacterium]MBP6696712.1 DUF3667 domain-containing protein [Flavobacteriales bacterium]